MKHFNEFSYNHAFRELYHASDFAYQTNPGFSTFDENRKCYI